MGKSLVFAMSNLRPLVSSSLIVKSHPLTGNRTPPSPPTAETSSRAGATALRHTARPGQPSGIKSDVCVSWPATLLCTTSSIFCPRWPLQRKPAIALHQEAKPVTSPLGALRGLRAGTHGCDCGNDSRVGLVSGERE